MTKRTVLAALEATHHQDRFIALLRERGIDTVLRHTEDGRIYGATFIDHSHGAVCSTAHAWAGNFQPMPCRNTSRCHTPTRSQ